MAWLAGVRFEFMRRVQAGIQKRFFHRLSRAVAEGAPDQWLVAIHALRLLPLRVIEGDQQAFDQALFALAKRCALDDRVPTLRRLQAMRRCLTWPSDIVGYMTPTDLAPFGWELLLQLAQREPDEAARFVGESQFADGTGTPFSSLGLWDRPDLAYGLAKALRGSAPEFAARMLCDAIARVHKPSLTQDDTTKAMVDQSCTLLAAWTLPVEGLGDQTLLLAVRCLLQFGDPVQSYWSELPALCLSLLDRMPDLGLDARLSLLAQIQFYWSEGNPFAEQAAKKTTELLSSRFEAVSPGPPDLSAHWLSEIQAAVYLATGRRLALVSDSVLSGRNSRFPSDPNHSLSVQAGCQIDALVSRVMAAEPQWALTCRAEAICGMAHKPLAIRHLEILKAEFAQLAVRFPENAGLALMLLARRYLAEPPQDEANWANGEAKRTFEDLVAVLENVSLKDAEVARSGVYWSSRGDI